MSNNIYFCTLFDSHYLDRGILMLRSLIDSCSKAMVYVIALDKRCEEILLDISFNNVVVVGYDEFEDDALRELKKSRSFKSFVWSCSSYSIKYCINKFQLNMCTYIDADLYFFSSPENMLADFTKSCCDAAIIGHNYSQHIENKYYEKTFGKYCVQFNTFRNTENGMKILDWWIDRCMENCPDIPTEEAFGDQKYLDYFFNLFEGIYEYTEFGAGIAPWNIDDYVKWGDKLRHRITNQEGKLIFYHFHFLEIRNNGYSNLRVFIRPGKHDKGLIYSLYRPYITSICEIRQMLKDRFSYIYEDHKSSCQQNAFKLVVSLLTSETNVVFLARKIWRYLLYKKNDYINACLSIEGSDCNK